jgi:hypothetical protein
MILLTDWEDGKALKDFDDDNNSSWNHLTHETACVNQISLSCL